MPMRRILVAVTKHKIYFIIHLIMKTRFCILAVVVGLQVSTAFVVTDRPSLEKSTVSKEPVNDDFELLPKLEKLQKSAATLTTTKVYRDSIPKSYAPVDVSSSEELEEK